jgi:hypothetical protein
MPPITDTKADGPRVRFGPLADIGAFYLIATFRTAKQRQ